MVAWRTARTWRAHGWVRVVAVALPLLPLPAAVWPSLLGPSFDTDPRPSRVVILYAVYVGFAALAWVAFRLRICLSRGVVRVTNAGRSAVFEADDVLAVQPTARGCGSSSRVETPSSRMPCPVPLRTRASAPAGSTSPRPWQGGTPSGSASSGAGPSPRVSADARTTTYRLTGPGRGAEVAVCRRALGLLRPRLHEVVLTIGSVDDWPTDLSAEVAARIRPQRGHRARPLGRRTVDRLISDSTSGSTPATPSMRPCSPPSSRWVWASGRWSSTSHASPDVPDLSVFMGQHGGDMDHDERPTVAESAGRPDR